MLSSVGMTESERINQEGIVEYRGPFQVTHRELKHDKFGMQLIADTVIRPDGSEGNFYWVNFTKPAVLVFPLDQDGNLYMTHEFTYATNKFSYEVPGGSLEQFQTFEQAARYEALTELGLILQDLTYLGILRVITSRINIESHLFLASVYAQTAQELEPGEIIKLHKIKLDDAYEKVISREIDTASVAYGILRIKEILASAQKGESSGSK